MNASPLTSAEILQREFFEMRCKILELAAAFDRLERAEGDLSGDPRMARLCEGLEIVQSSDTCDRAEQVQLAFSREYDEGWKKSLNMPAKSR